MRNAEHVQSAAQHRFGRVARSGLALALAPLLLASPAGAAETFKVIVNVKVPGRTVPKETLAQIYLGRVKRWRDGRPIDAVDLPSASPVRVAFSKAVLDMTVLGVRAHWMQLLLLGERPPLTRPTDDAVIAHVAAQAAAIGYVSEAAPLPDTVKAVAVE